MSFQVTKPFLLAGKAIFTIHNGSGTHFTYKVAVKRAIGREDIYFVSLLTGPDNLSDYTYIGVLCHLTGAFRLTQRSKLTGDAKPVIALRWALQYVWHGLPVPQPAGCHGEGRCGRCGIRLTHPDGIAPEGHRLGFGPECWKHVKGAFAA